MAPSVDGLILRHFGLRENPFGVTPDPRFLFMSLTHREALASLVSGIECGFGFQVLVAQPGMGKTTLLFDLLERFQSSRTAFLFQQQHDSREFLQSLLIELKSDTAETSHAKLYSQLNHFLSEAALTRERVIVVVDEAQNLEDSVLETLRQLSNFETARSKLLQIVLAGQPQLARKLAQPEQEQLRQRVSTIARLSPLGLDETRNYLTHRLNVAGYRGPEFFTKDALQIIWSSGHGIPRNINTLCFNAMLLAFVQGTKQVDERATKAAVQDLDLECVLADVAGFYQPSDELEGKTLTSRISLQAEKPTRVQPPAAVQFASNSSPQSAVPEPATGIVLTSAPVIAAERNPVSDGSKAVSQPPIVLKSPANGNGTPVVDPDKGSPSMRISEGLQQRRQEPVVVPVSSNQAAQPAIAAMAPSSRGSNAKKLLWASLVAAAVGGGVLFGHGLGNRGQHSAAEQPESISRMQQTGGPQALLDSPLAQSGASINKDRDRKSNPDADDGPEVVVRTFPQSAPGATQENAKAIFFDGDSAEVSSKYSIALERIAEILNASPQSNAILEGHTDTSGEESYNLDLSMRRAVAVKDVLVRQYQIAASRLSTVGVGSSAPIESNFTSSGRAYNRRVEMRIVQPETSLAAGSAGSSPQ